MHLVTWRQDRSTAAGDQAYGLSSEVGEYHGHVAASRKLSVLPCAAKTYVVPPSL